MHPHTIDRSIFTVRQRFEFQEPSACIRRELDVPAVSVFGIVVEPVDGTVRRASMGPAGTMRRRTGSTRLW